MSEPKAKANNVTMVSKKLSRVIFYLILIFLPTQLGKHFWPNFSFVKGIRIDYLSPTIYFTDILILLLFLTSILNSFKFINKFTIFNLQFLINLRKINFKILKLKKLFQISRLAPASTQGAAKRANFKFQILFLFLLLGVLFSKSPELGLYGLLKFFEFLFFGFYVAKNLKFYKLSSLTTVFSIAILYESIIAIFQFLNQSSLGGFFYLLGERTFNSQTPGIANASLNGEILLRPYGTFSHPNVLAGYILITLTLIIFNFQFSIFNKFSNINFRNIVITLSILFGSAALFLTMSRVAIVLWALIVFINLLNRTTGNFSSLISHLSFRKFVLLVIICSIGIIFLLSPIRYRLSNINLNDESVVKRQELFLQSINLIKQKPLFGVGLNNYLINTPPLFDKNIFFLQPVHNIYLLTTEQIGIIAFFFFIYFIYRTIKRIKPPFINNSKFMILTMVLVLGMVDHYFLTLQQGQLLFVFCFGFIWSDLK